MSKIYSDFEELASSHQSIFKMYKNSKTPGILKAIWEARDAEIEAEQNENQKLRKELAEVKKENARQKKEIRKKSTEFNQQVENHKKEIQKKTRENYQLQEDYAKETRALNLLQNQYDSLKKSAQNISDQLKTARKYIDSLEFAHKSEQKKVYNLERRLSASEGLKEEFEVAMNEQAQSNKELVKLKEKLEQRINEQGEEIIELKNQLRGYRSLNNKMSVELDRSKRELGQIHASLTQ